MKENRDKWIIKKKVKCDAMQYNIIHDEDDDTFKVSAQASQQICFYYY